MKKRKSGPTWQVTYRVESARTESESGKEKVAEW